jgi:hypothetical protein
MAKLGNKNAEKPKNWIDEMIEREASPEALREETTDQFCAKRKIAKSTYYFQKNRTENSKKILNLSLNNAKKYTSDVLDNLGKRAKTDNKAAELYLNYVLELKKRLDLTSNDKELPTPILGYVSTDISHQEDSES